MASGPPGPSDNRDAAANSTEVGALDESESREEGGSKGLPAATIVHAIEAPSIEVGSRADDDFDLSSELEDDNSTASLSSSILSAYTYEGGRRYSSFGDGRYPIPNDEMEQNREHMKHAMLMALTENKLFLSPIGNHPQKILDIGTGTVGDRYPSAKVRGIDITAIQPKWVPPNVSFIVDDCELDWIERDVDLAHFRHTIVLLKDTSKILGHAFESLRPGGWIELQEYQTLPMCDDETMPDDDPVKYLYETVGRTYEKFGLQANLPPNLESYLQDAGFENIHCQIFKSPIGPWAKDKTMRLVGADQRTAVGEGLSLLAGRPFQALGISEAEAQVIIAMARKGLEDPNVHRYFNYYFWYAQKPVSSAVE
ncbi:hypothetical protein E4U33_002293 [Claviceps sp. LM78 group G4]|nr:hypothetical protein E4U33_002293 [Claviceps sp. LM78 group G4]